MCIIAHIPAGKFPGNDILENCWSSNRDGAGFSYIQDGQLRVDKGFFRCEDLIDAIKPHVDKELVVHFRLATHGPTDVDNCHPWMVEGKKHSFAIAHNGILQCPSTATRSDTGWFVENVLGPQLKRDPWFLDTEGGRWMLEKAIGTFNKLVVMRSDGRVYRINGDQGTEDAGVWYSNHGFRNSFGRGGMYGGYWGGLQDAWDDDPRIPAGYIAKQPRTIQTLIPTALSTIVRPEPDKTAEGNDKPVVKYDHMLKLDKIGEGHYSHVLNKKGRKTLKKLALEALGQDGVHLTDQELINGLRRMARDTFGWMSSLPDVDVDREIVKMGWRGI